MSPRRSSRARSAQNPPSAPPHTNSSSSVTNTTKENRNTRSNNSTTRTVSPVRRTSTVRSESLEDTDTASRATDGTIAPRRSRRGELEVSDQNKAHTPGGDEKDVEVTAEEDITRCICGRVDYPGPGASVKEQLLNGESISEDVGNFFIQCDKCHVWQHGGCMGLTNESMLPEEYYCEICKPEFHRIIKASNGIKSSRYLPILEGAISEGSSPLSSAGDLPRKGSSKNKSSEITKRRATMNSRGAYDEDEMLRRAIEESREMGTLKRPRDESEDQKQTLKRQRTGSSASSIGFRRSQSPQPTTEESAARSAINGSKNNKLRGAAAKNNREKELRDKQKEALANQRAEAASKRNARSERRRGEESPPPSPGPSPSKPVTTLAKPSATVKDATPPAKLSINRKGGRPPARRGRLGRNQYTRDLPLNGDASDSSLRDTSRPPHGADSPRPHTNGHSHRDGINGESGRSSKAKTHPARTSLNEMKRRVAAILEFVGRMQSERNVGAKSNSSDGSSSSSLKGNSTPNGSSLGINLPTANLVKAVVEGLEEANTAKVPADTEAMEDAMVKVELMPGKTFEVMNSTEMMDTLTSELVKWQRVWGVYGR